MELTIQDIEHDFQQIIDASVNTTTTNTTTSSSNNNDVINIVNIMFQHVTENIIENKDTDNNNNNLDEEIDKEYQAEEILDIFQTFSVNKNILHAMKARAIVEESECYNNIIKLENQIVQQFNKYNHNCSNSSSSDDDGSSSSPPSPLTSLSTSENIINADIIKESVNQYNILCDELKILSGMFDSRLADDDDEKEENNNNNNNNVNTTTGDDDPTTTTIINKDDWNELNQYKQLLSKSIDKNKYIEHLCKMLQNKNTYIVRLNSFKHNDDILNNPDNDTMHQMAKDIERDVVLINNDRLVHGSEYGYDGICKVIKDEINRVREYQYTSSTNGNILLPPFESIDPDILDNFVGNIVFACNRTQSGGDTFDLLNQIFFHNELAILAPDSDNIPPLEIIIDCGPYKEHPNFRGEFGTYCWAVRATVKAKMIFNICDMSPMDEDTAVWGKVSGCFERLLVMPVKILSNKTYYYDRGLTDRGVVTVELSDLIDMTLADEKLEEKQNMHEHDNVTISNNVETMQSNNVVDDKLLEQDDEKNNNSNSNNNNNNDDEDFLEDVDSFIQDDNIMIENSDEQDEYVDKLIDATRNEHFLLDDNDDDENGWEDEEDIVEGDLLGPIEEEDDDEEKTNIVLQSKIREEILAKDNNNNVDDEEKIDLDDDKEDEEGGWDDADDDIFDDLA